MPFDIQADANQVGSVYLLHFLTGLPHGSQAVSRHYAGWALNAEERIELHQRGTSGARIMEVVKERGIQFTVARIWDGVTREFERKLKNAGGLSRWCPICKAEGLDRDSLRKKKVPVAVQEVPAAAETPAAGPDIAEVEQLPLFKAARWTLFAAGPEIAPQETEVEPVYRRKGIGTALLKELQRMYPETEIDLGMATDEGAKFLESTKFREEPTEHQGKFEELKTVQEEAARLQKIADEFWEKEDHTPEEKEAFIKATENWNEVNDRVWELEQLLKDEAPVKRIVAAAGRLTRDNAVWKGKKFALGAVSLLDGQIEEAHSYQECLDAGWHHTSLFSEDVIEREREDFDWSAHPRASEPSVEKNPRQWQEAPSPGSIGIFWITDDFRVAANAPLSQEIKDAIVKQIRPVRRNKAASSLPKGYDLPPYNRKKPYSLKWLWNPETEEVTLFSHEWLSGELGNTTLHSRVMKLQGLPLGGIMYGKTARGTASINPWPPQIRIFSYGAEIDLEIVANAIRDKFGLGPEFETQANQQGDKGYSAGRTAAPRKRMKSPLLRPKKPVVQYEASPYLAGQDFSELLKNGGWVTNRGKPVAMRDPMDLHGETALDEGLCGYDPSEVDEDVPDALGDAENAALQRGHLRVDRDLGQLSVQAHDLRESRRLIIETLLMLPFEGDVYLETGPHDYPTWQKNFHSTQDAAEWLENL